VSRRRLPSSGTPREALLIWLFDLLWVAGAIWVYGVPALGVLYLEYLILLHLPDVLAALFLPVAYVLFLVGMILCAGLLRAVLPKPRPGMSRVFVGRDFAAFLVSWGLEAYFVKPFITHIQLLTALRWLHGRALGMRLHWTTHISPGTEIHSYPLVSAGRFTYFGEGTGVTGHLSRGDKLLQAPVSFGDHCNVGARTNIGPGCKFGDRVKVGALVDFAPGVECEDDVEIEPRVHIGMGVRIEKGAYVEARAYLPTYMIIPAGERWGGDPAQKLGMAVQRNAQGRRRAVKDPGEDAAEDAVD